MENYSVIIYFDMIMHYVVRSVNLVMGTSNWRLRFLWNYHRYSFKLEKYIYLLLCGDCIYIEEFVFLYWQLEAEGQGLRGLPFPWTCNASAGSSSFAVHPSQSNHMECEPDPVLQIGYTYISSIYLCLKFPSSLSFTIGRPSI